MAQSYTGENQEIKLHEGGVLYRDSLGVERNLSWSNLVGLKRSVLTQKISVVGKEGSVSLAFLSTEQQKLFIAQLYGMWRVRNLDAAKKNAFDFVDHQRGFSWLMFFMSSCFFLPVGYVMLQDSFGQWQCSKLLHSESQWTTAQVVKTKKKRKGHHILTLEFEVNGQKIHAMDQFFPKEENAVPPTSMPVLYSPQKASCWILAKPDEATPLAHWQKRKFFTTYLSMFGFVLSLTGLLGLAWSLLRFLDKNPHRSDVKDIFQFH